MMSPAMIFFFSFVTNSSYPSFPTLEVAVEPNVTGGWTTVGIAPDIKVLATRRSLATAVEYIKDKFAKSVDAVGEKMCVTTLMFWYRWS